jgi:hypothetical protein
MTAILFIDWLPTSGHTPPIISVSAIGLQNAGCSRKGADLCGTVPVSLTGTSTNLSNIDVMGMPYST